MRANYEEKRKKNEVAGDFNWLNLMCFVTVNVLQVKLIHIIKAQDKCPKTENAVTRELDVYVSIRDVSKAQAGSKIETF